VRPWTIHRGDVRAVVRTLAEKSIDAACLDPPYGLRFMGRRWDYSVPSVNVWSAMLRVLKPGAHAVIFGGSRTFHRLVVNVEDGGFEIRDVLMWLYGAGWPKSHDVSKAVDKRLGAKRTKVVGHKNSGLDKGSGSTVSFRGATGRDETGLIPITAPATAAADWEGYGTGLKPAYEPALLARRMLGGTVANAALEHGVVGLDLVTSRVGEDVLPAAISGSSRMFKGVKNVVSLERVGRWPSNVVLTHDPFCVDAECASWCPVRMIDEQSRGASRFFYTAKASRSERDRGLGEGEHSSHPTVKPQDLVRYFARMVLPPKRRDGSPRRILVPFSGSGSEMIACLQAGWDEVVGIEQSLEYCEIAEARIRKGSIFERAALKKR